MELDPKCVDIFVSDQCPLERLSISAEILNKINRANTSSSGQLPSLFVYPRTSTACSSLVVGMETFHGSDTKNFVYQGCYEYVLLMSKLPLAKLEK